MGHKGASVVIDSAKMGSAAEQGLLSATYVSRAVKDLSVVKSYYKAVFGNEPVSETTLSDGAKIADYQPGGKDVTVRYVQRSGLSGNSTDWFQTLLLNTANKYQTSYDSCWPIWGDFHYGGSFGSNTILEDVTAAGKLGFPYRSFAGGAGPSNAYVVEPSGMWVQIGGDSTGLPAPGGFSTSYCYTFCK